MDTPGPPAPTDILAIDEALDRLGRYDPDQQRIVELRFFAGLTVDETAQEVFLTVQHDSAIVVYRKGASGEEPPIRMLQGDRTRLADPHALIQQRYQILAFGSTDHRHHRLTRSEHSRHARRQPAEPGDGLLRSRHSHSDVRGRGPK